MIYTLVTIVHNGIIIGQDSGADPGLIVGLSIPRALARAKFYVLRPLLTSFLRW